MRNPAAGLAVVGLGASLAAMDLAVNVAFPSVTAAFALKTEQIRWLVVSYVLTYASLMLACGKLGDRIGHRRVFRAGLLLAIVAYTLCALAPSYEALLAARVVQGVSTALVLSCAPALATFLFEESKRTRALGAYSSLSAIAGIVAPIVGGLSIAALGWAGVFWFRVPVAVLAALLLPMLPEQQSTRPTSDHGAELAGSALLAAGLAAGLLAFPLALSIETQRAAVPLALAAIAVLALFVRHQRRAANSVLPRGVLRDPAFALPNLASVALYLAVFAVPLLTPYYLERIARYTPLTSGAALACSPAGVLLGSLVAAALVRRIGARRAALAAGILVAAGQLAIGLWTESPQLAAILLALVVHGFGIGLFSVAYTDIVVAALPRSDRGVAGSLTMLTRTIGVITGAAALIGALSAIEAREIAAGNSADDAFLHAYASVFQLSALVLAVVVPLCFVRRGSTASRAHE